MRILPYVFLLLMGMTWRCVQSTCVFETDFGLSINCGLKKSGMFRVRNLGGLKGYVGLGIQLADELGFKESLSTLEQNSKRRSVNSFPVPGSFEPLDVSQNNNRDSMTTTNSVNQDRSVYAKMNGRSIGGNSPAATVPPFRPLVSAASSLVRNVRLSAQQQQQQQQQQQPLLKPLPVPAFAALPESIAKVAVETPQPPAAQRKIEPVAIAAIVPVAVNRMAGQQMLQPISSAALTALRRHVVAPSAFVSQQPIPAPASTSVPPPPPPPPQRHSSVYNQNAMQLAANRRFNAFSSSPQNPVDVRPIIVMPTSDHRKKQPDSSPLSNEVDSQSMMSLFHAAAAHNVSVEELALALRQQQQKRLSPFYSTTDATNGPIVSPASTTSTTTTTAPPPSTTAHYPDGPTTKKITIRPYKSKYSSGHKVMNAPKEYYPVGYEKNFDDNFVSKVDLPDTSFSCGDQKHFPGLYGDEDLGCMVFHVCAFTDDGLTQKSFLCPESTLFDQTILKCNWWFYVDCKSSKKLYDSNIPVSKSYQLMKALTFFSSYSAGPTIEASMAAASAAVSPLQPPETASSSVATATTTTTTTDVLDNVSFSR